MGDFTLGECILFDLDGTEYVGFIVQEDPAKTYTEEEGHRIHYGYYMVTGHFGETYVVHEDDISRQ